MGMCEKDGNQLGGRKKEKVCIEKGDGILNIIFIIGNMFVCSTTNSVIVKRVIVVAIKKKKKTILSVASCIKTIFEIIQFCE